MTHCQILFKYSNFFDNFKTIKTINSFSFNGDYSLIFYII